MEPWQSWTIIGILGAGGYWYYTNSQKSSRGRTQKPAPASQPPRHSSNTRDASKGGKKKGKAKVLNEGNQNPVDVSDVPSAPAATSGEGKLVERKGDRDEREKLRQSSAVDVKLADKVDAASYEPEEAADNNEFAKHMSGLKQGTFLKKSDATSDTTRTKKQGKQNESRQATSFGKAVEPTGRAGSHEMSTASSTTGADADDDLSPAASPALGASHAASNAAGLADMLEASAKGPSVLRLTSPTQSQPERQQKPKKPAPETETKKQRQNRQKNEEKRVAREEVEKGRRALMEKQRRTAREAEGKPAMNGLGSMPPTTSVWSELAKATVPNGSPRVGSGINGPLLDTFNESSRSDSTSSALGIKGSAADQKAWEKDIPSEEEQMRLLSEMDGDGWSTVAKGGRAKKKKAESAIDEENQLSTSDNATNGNGHIKSKASERKRPSVISTSSSKAKGPPSPMFGVVPPKFKTTKDQVDPKIWNRKNIHNHPDYDPEYPYALTGHPEDSDWAVV